MDRYRVIINSNTSIMSPALLARIERWVRNGGTFITYVQTGRHTPTEPNSWPISRLTGYAVTRIDRYGGRNQPLEAHALHPAPGQTLFQGEPWTTGLRASGMSLKKTAADCQDLLLWEDGSVAAGVRRIGAGRIFHLGAHFETLGDRRDSPHTTALFAQILAPMQVERVPGQARDVMMRHYISNNGLHDVWVLYNDRDRPVNTDLIFLHPRRKSHCLDSEDRAASAHDGGREPVGDTRPDAGTVRDADVPYSASRHRSGFSGVVERAAKLVARLQSSTF